MNNAEHNIGNDYLASDLQLRELFGSILQGDCDYARDMLKLFENQKLERLREDREASEATRERQEVIEHDKLTKGDD